MEKLSQVIHFDLGWSPAKDSFQPMTPTRGEKKSPVTASKQSFGGRSSLTKDKKKGGEIQEIKFRNASDIAFDSHKFQGCSIIHVCLDIHGQNLTQKAAEHIGKFLQSVGRIEKLSLNLSISAIAKEHAQPIAAGLASLLNLHELELDLSRSKIETEAFQLIADAISSLGLLRNLNISVEK